MFGCGVLKILGRKKQDFWPKIDMLKGKPLYFENTGSASSSKIGHDFRKQSGSKIEVRKMFCTKNGLLNLYS